jgi:hypothetical protein
MEKEDIIDFILIYNLKADRTELEKLSVEALLMIKVQIELKLEQQFYN